MNRERYLDRIQFGHRVKPELETLVLLHEHHMFHVPFENLDIHYKRLFDLDLENISRKVIDQNRGGFCYELNYLFHSLLRDIGFKSSMISSRIFKDTGERGPEYDHMSILVELDKKYLVDVGFGELFIRPLEIREGVQSDGRNFFKIERLEGNEFSLSMSADGRRFSGKYSFTLTGEPIEAFQESCLDKQTNADSYFVRNTICTLPTQNGRITLFNNKLISKQGEKRTGKTIHTETELRQELKSKFGIDIPYEVGSFCRQTSEI